MVMIAVAVPSETIADGVPEGADHPAKLIVDDVSELAEGHPPGAAEVLRAGRHETKLIEFGCTIGTY
jgi:hypothetical protein